MPEEALPLRTNAQYPPPVCHRSQVAPLNVVVATTDPEGVWPWSSTQNMTSLFRPLSQMSYIASASVPATACMFSAYELDRLLNSLSG